MVKHNWSVPTSPRSPYKIKNELILLREFEGKTWDNDAQVAYGRLLAKSETFEGDVPDENADWAGRARFGTISFWGFAFKDSNDKLRITEVGNELISAAKEKEDEIFARQLVKWQYPDNQHNGNEYPLGPFQIHPFVATLRLLSKVDYLTKNEIALFVFMMTRDEDVKETAESLIAYRKALGKIKGKVPRKQFMFYRFRGMLLRHFKAELKDLLGNLKQTTLFQSDLDRLQSKNKKKVEEFVYRHFRTFQDYADALIRYFRYTQIVTLSGSGKYNHQIEIPTHALDKAKSIIRMKADIREYSDTNSYYQDYYGKIEGLALPYENVTDLTKITTTLIQSTKKLCSELSKYVPAISVSIPSFIPTKVSELKKLEDLLRTQSRNLQKDLISIELKQKKAMSEIVEMYDSILKKGEVIDPPTFLEWNTWRAFASLNVADKIVPHLVFSDDMQPLSPAGGNVPDLEVYYPSFIVVPEVTLKSGATQARDEAEPVPVHVIKIQRANPKVQTYGVFVAPKIDDRTSNVFYGCKYSPDLFGDRTNVIPFTIKQFQFIVSVIGISDYDPQKLYSLLHQIDLSREKFQSLEADRGVAWVNNIQSVIDSWAVSLPSAPTPSVATARSA